MIIYLTDKFDFDKQCCGCGKLDYLAKEVRYTNNDWLHSYIVMPEKVMDFIFCHECYQDIFNSNRPYDVNQIRNQIKEMLHKTTGYPIKEE